MLKRKSYYVIISIIGICLVIIGLLLRQTEITTRAVEGVLLGIGAGMFGSGASNFFMKRWEEKEPDLMKQKEIEFLDERNTIIRNRAKAKAADIIQWMIMALAYVTILIGAPLWVTLVTVLVFLMKNILEVYFMTKFQKEM